METCQVIPKQPPHPRGTGVPNPIDVHVGKRIRVRRLLSGMSLDALAEALGITFQQVQKYETGANRVSASRLSAMADALRVPISYFFGDVRSYNDTPSPSSLPLSNDLTERPETIELIQLYYAIRDETVRQQVRATVRALAEASAPLPEAPKHGRGGRRAH